MNYSIIGYLHENGTFSTDKSFLTENFQGNHEKIIIVISEKEVIKLYEELKNAADEKVVS